MGILRTILEIIFAPYALLIILLFAIVFLLSIPVLLIYFFGDIKGIGEYYVGEDLW